jgi:hypothetical protein
MERRPDVLCVRVQLLLGHNARLADLTCHGTLVTHCLDNIACPRFALSTNESCTFRYASEGFAEVPRATNEWDLERVLVDVILLVRGR